MPRTDMIMLGEVQDVYSTRWVDVWWVFAEDTAFGTNAVRWIESYYIVMN